MEWTSIITALISAASAIIVAVVANKYRKQSEANDKQVNRRKKESMLNLQMVEATLELSSVTAEAVTNGHLNGNVESAKAKAAQARQAYSDFLKEVAMEEVIL